jgi:uncharacterized protein involved in exopolysaccharide biosynthesis
MGDSPEKKESKPAAERLVYVMPEQSVAGVIDDEIRLRDLWDILWGGKWAVIAITSFFALGSVAYALLATEWYRAEVLLAPAEEKTISPLGDQLGGLAALAGVSVGGGDSSEAIAVLRSRDFARSFIRDFELLTVFFAGEWDGQKNLWIERDPDKWPDLRDAVDYFHDKVLTVSEDRKTRLVAVSVDWTDPESAADWASELVRRLNGQLRAKALTDAKANIDYLSGELAETNIVSLQQSIGRLLENELQKYMLARGNTEFAFRVIDGAETPKDTVWPNRPLIAIFGTLLGGIFALVYVLVRHAALSQSSNVGE